MTACMQSLMCRIASTTRGLQALEANGLNRRLESRGVAEVACTASAAMDSWRERGIFAALWWNAWAPCELPPGDEGAGGPVNEPEKRWRGGAPQCTATVAAR